MLSSVEWTHWQFGAAHIGPTSLKELDTTMNQNCTYNLVIIKCVLSMYLGLV